MNVVKVVTSLDSIQKDLELLKVFVIGASTLLLLYTYKENEFTYLVQNLQVVLFYIDDKFFTHILHAIPNKHLH